jgi:hypothetical protein
MPACLASYVQDRDPSVLALNLRSGRMEDHFPKKIRYSGNKATTVIRQNVCQ